MLFSDRSLSATGAMSCATCHAPDHAYGPPNDLAVQLGGPDGRTEGPRAVPSLRYKEYTPAYADLLDNPDGISAPGPGGGFAWDGRADTLAQQARLPLLSPAEMANASPDDVVRKIAAAPYADRFRAAFPGVGWTDPARAFEAALTRAGGVPARGPQLPPLHAASSTCGRATRSAARSRPPRRAATKSSSTPSAATAPPATTTAPGWEAARALFTDYSYEAIGVPRNRSLAANQDPGHVDLGLCGPQRTDRLPGAGTNNFCGMFKTPTLRNVATRKVFFHNGVIHSLEQAIRFYATRDTRPELWYPTVGGHAKAHPDRAFPTLRPHHQGARRRHRPEV